MIKDGWFSKDSVCQLMWLVTKNSLCSMASAWNSQISLLSWTMLLRASYMFLGDLLGVFPICDQYLAALQIARDMQAIHQLNVLHHDLRAANILIGPASQRRCRIADFGLSRAKMESSRFSTKKTGNPAWSAPEYLAGNTPFTAACDVFSYGMVLFEICSDPPGTAPFDGQGDNVRSLYLEGKRPLIPK